MRVSGGGRGREIVFRTNRIGRRRFHLRLDMEEPGGVVSLQCCLVDEGQNGLNHQGSSQVGSPGLNQCLAGVVEVGQRRTSDIGGVVAEPVTLGDPRQNRLIGGEVCLHPLDREGPEEQPPKVPVVTVQQGSRGEPTCAACHAPNQVLGINDGTGAAAH